MYASQPTDFPEELPGFIQAMQLPTVDAELFFPIDNAKWDGNEYLLDESARKALVKNSGVRLQDTSADTESDRQREQVRWDLANLVASLIVLRQQPGLRHIIVSQKFVRTQDNNKVDRIKFGLKSDESYADEQQAAKAMHANIDKVIRKAGYIVEAPQDFDHHLGMNGLLAWAKEVSLQKRRWRLPWWWLLLLLLLLLLPWLRGCSAYEFIGIPVETKSLVILIDQSKSMQPYMQPVREEAKRLLATWESTYTTHYINIIAFNDQATSALGDLKAVDKQSANDLNTFLDQMQMDGGTNLRTAINAASQEIVRHQRPVTVIVLTDGEDPSIAGMLRNIQSVKDSFQGVDVTVKTCTPRLFQGGDTTPATPAEVGLRDFAKEFGGSFGPQRGTP